MIKENKVELKKKIMKNIAIITIMILSWTAQGQSKMDASKMSNYHIEQIESTLHLTEEQRKETNTVIFEFSEKMAVLMNKDGGMFGKIAAMREIGKEKNKNLGAIFTEEQMEQYEDEIEPKVRKHFRNTIKD